MEFVIIALALYLLPSIVALSRHHTNKLAIIALNILVGWTFIGWVISIVWALTSNVSYAPPKSIRKALFRAPWELPEPPRHRVEPTPMESVRREIG
jgi:hypothetical protein